MSKKPVTKVIPISDVRENPVALRTVNLEDERYIGLRDSISAAGILSPPSVRQREEVIDGKKIVYYELVDGLHRFSAAKQLGHTEIPVNIVSLDDAATHEAQIMANLHIIETKPVEFTRQLHRLFASNPTLTLDDMAVKVCKSTTWVNQRLSLLKLEPVISKLVDEGKIKVSNAVALSKLPPNEQANYVDQAVTMSADEFIPLVQARAKEIKVNARKGRTTEPVVFVPQPRLQKMSVLKDEMENPQIGPALVKQQKTKQPADAFNLGISWALSMDPASIEVRKATDVARKQQLEDDKKKRAAERAKEKAEVARKAAIEAAEAVA